jgi:23S rRNA (cytosine1962-C5)-methyltransferase
LEVDVYLLDSGRFLLFAHIKDQALGDGRAFLTELAAREFAGGVVAVGRARKTPEGSEPLPCLWLEPRPESGLVAVEHGIRYALEVEHVLNPGLFLDQRDNRLRFIELVRRAALTAPFGEDDGALNLFSYTGSFSLAACVGGATRTTSVDVSARYLAWERRNFELNFDVTRPPPRLIKDDARDFVRRAKKSGKRFRFIVVDPPTFSRGQGQPFRVREELAPLVGDALACFPEAGGAALLASTNDSRYSRDEFLFELARVAERAGLRMEEGAVPDGFADTAAKSAWILRDS